MSKTCKLKVEIANNLSYLSPSKSCTPILHYRETGWNGNGASSIFLYRSYQLETVTCTENV